MGPRASLLLEEAALKALGEAEVPPVESGAAVDASVPGINAWPIAAEANKRIEQPTLRIILRLPARKLLQIAFHFSMAAGLPSKS
jgi:hypothetical protein